MPTFDTTPATSNGSPQNGTYANWPGIQSVLGVVNASNQSNLDSENVNPNDTLAPDYDRINQTIVEADAYTNRRARTGNNQYLTPIPDTSADFPLIQRAANLYAAFQLVRHRIWWGTEGDDEQARIMLGLRKQYTELFDMLFGPARDGIDGATPNPDGEPEPGTITEVTIDRGWGACLTDEYSG